MRGIFLGLSVFVTALPSLVLADEAKPVCTAPVAPTGEMAPWSSPSPLDAAVGKAHLPHAQVAVGKAVALTLHAADGVAFPVKPEKAGGNGGLVQLTIVEAGTYRVALGTAGWIDVGKGETTLQSVSHGHGPACSGIRKIVDFSLTPGTYFIAISANAEARTQLLVAKKP